MMDSSMLSFSSAEMTNLCSLRCGKINVHGTSAHADPRKGRLVVLFGREDQMFRVRWYERNAPACEDEYIVFPTEAEFQRVANVKDGRVWDLNFHGDRHVLFWVQEPASEKDEEIFAKINGFLLGKVSPLVEPTAQASGADAFLSGMKNGPGGSGSGAGGASSMDIDKP
eukprot:ANDGO_03714.mRNA.1 Proteasomal ubiquitin receptor ADRM1 homolog